MLQVAIHLQSFNKLLGTRRAASFSDTGCEHNMRAARASKMSKGQDSSLTEPATLQEARQRMVTASVRKTFAACDDFAGGDFTGVVEGVDGRVTQEDGSVAKGIFYRVK